MPIDRDLCGSDVDSVALLFAHLVVVVPVIVLVLVLLVVVPVCALDTAAHYIPVQFSKIYECTVIQCKSTAVQCNNRAERRFRGDQGV